MLACIIIGQAGRRGGGGVDERWLFMYICVMINFRLHHSSIENIITDLLRVFKIISEKIIN